jgi:hypothetical protein
MGGPGPRSDLTIKTMGGGWWAVELGAGRVHADLPDVATAGWVRDLYALDVRAADPRWDEVGGKQVLGYRDCIQNRRADSGCAGNVEYRYHVGRADRRLPLCNKHWADRVADRCMPAQRGTAGAVAQRSTPPRNTGTHG